MSVVDKDSSGFIDYTGIIIIDLLLINTYIYIYDYKEFVVASLNKEKILSKEKLDVAFKLFDKDGSGKISVKEL